MTQPPDTPETPGTPSSIYTSLDGSPLSPPPQAPPAIPGSTAWSGAAAPAQLGPASQHFVLATWGSRFGAYLLDGLLFGLLAWLAMVPVGVALGLTVSESASYFGRVGALPESVVDTTPFYIAFAVQAMVPGIALALCLVRLGGQTPGKRVTGIRVVRADGQPMDPRTAFRRELGLKGILLPLLGIVTLFIGLLLNYLWPLWDREHRTWHDMIAKTRVVQAPK